MRKLVNNKSGFTLIELLVAMLLAGVVITTVYQIMTVSSKANNAANEQIEAANALDRTMENIRQITMSATNMTICDANTVSPTSNETVIKCINNVIYLDDREIGSAAQYGAESVQLEFGTSNERKVLTVELNSYDENGGILEGKSRSIDLFLQSIGGDGNGKIETDSEGQKNCIVFSTIQ